LPEIAKEIQDLREKENSARIKRKTEKKFSTWSKTKALKVKSQVRDRTSELKEYQIDALN